VDQHNRLARQRYDWTSGEFRLDSRAPILQSPHKFHSNFPNAVNFGLQNTKTPLRHKADTKNVSPQTPATQQQIT